jgi:hypothetical protein
MADYKDKLEEWREAARRKARELDEKYQIRERVEEGARVAGDAARRGAERAEQVAERARVEAERISEDFDLGERAGEVREHTKEAREKAGRAGEEAARVAREAGGSVRDASKRAGEKAGEAFVGAKNYYERAARVADMGARATRLTSASTVGLFRVYDWARENPKQAIVVSLSLAAGVRVGAAFPGLDAVFLGAHPHWFTHSALPVWALRKAGEKFDGYLRERERLISEGELETAERERIEFERKIVRYVGAPLLGAFSCAAGMAMWAQILQPGPIVGAPISWLLGGNPLLDGLWLFGNGVICFHQGYKFFMIALKDQADAERIVREIRGLLPAASVA